VSRRTVKPRIHLPLGGGGGAAPAAAGGGAGGGPLMPQTITLATGNTVVAGGHTHQLSIAPHTTDPAAHHAPVTLGNTGLSLSGQQLSLRLATVSGLSISSGLRLDDSVAGDGLAIANKVLAVGAGDGIDVSANAIAVDVTDLIGSGLVEEATNNIALNTPGTLSVSSPNAAAGNHTHAVTALASTMSGEEALLKSSEAGGLALASLQTSGAVDVGQGLTAGGSGFRVIHHTHDYPHVHVVVNPGTYWNLDEQFGVDIDDSLLVRGYIVGKHALQIADAAMICHFDGPEPYETDFTGSPTGHMGQTPTYAGATIYRPGRFGKALQCGSATTNLVDRPSLESADATGWGPASTSTMKRTAEDAYMGQYSMKVQRTNQTFAQVSFGEIAITNQPYTFSCYAKNIDVPTTGTVYLHFYWTGGSQPGRIVEVDVGTVADMTGEWRRFSATESPDYADRTELRVYIRASGADAEGQGFYTDCWQVEAGPNLTPYCDGSLGPMHAWDNPSSPHESTSTRAAAYLRYEKMADAFLGLQGTVMAWVRLEQIDSRQGILYISGDGANYIILRAYPGGVVHGFWGGQSTSSEGIAYVSANTWHHLAVVADGTDLILYLDGQEVVRDTISSPYTPAAGAILYVGADGASSYALNGLIDDLVIVKRGLDADEIRAVYESNAPVFAETSTWHWRAGRNLVWADAEGFWAVDQDGDPVFAISGVDNKSWGGVTLGAGDVAIGNVGQGHYLHWDDSLGTLHIFGDVTIEGDPGTTVTWNDVTSKPAGATRLGTGANPGGAGLWLTGDYMGYHAGGGTWPVWINNQGRFAFGNSAGTQYVKWDGSTFEVKGQIVVTSGSGIGSFSDAGALATANNLDGVPDGSTYGKLRKTIIGGGYIQVGAGTKDSTLNGWHIGSAEIVGQAAGVDQVVLDTSGRILAGGGSTRLNADGLAMVIGGTIGWPPSTGNQVRWVAPSDGTPMASVDAARNISGATYSQIGLSLRKTSVASAYLRLGYNASVGVSDLSTNVDRFTFSGAFVGLRVGTNAHAVETGNLHVEGGIGANFGGTPGAGDICAGGNFLTVGGYLYMVDATHYLYKSGDDLYWKPGAGAAVKLN
jgi:hypothetical protein